MSKVGGALPSWYWPGGIPRRVAVPQQPLSRQLQKGLKSKDERPAVWTAAAGWVSNEELIARATEIANGVQALDGDGPVAVVEADPLETLVLLMGIWEAARHAFVAAPDTPAALLETQLKEVGASVILTATGTPDVAGVRVVNKDALEKTEKKPARPGKVTSPALLVPAPIGVVVYAHFSLSSMASGIAAFIKELRDLSYLCLEPLCRWEALCGTIGALVRGQSVVFADSAALGGDIPRPDNGMFSIIGRTDADALLAGRGQPGVLHDLRYLFVSTGPFTARWRRQFEAFADKPILPLWGIPEIGPAVAAHPTWYPLDSHGFPLVNVSIVPIDPDTGEQSVVPWEMLTFAEIGVDTLSASIGYAKAGVGDPRIGKVVRTRQVANIDHVGVVTLHATS